LAGKPAFLNPDADAEDWVGPSGSRLFEETREANRRKEVRQVQPSWWIWGRAIGVGFGAPRVSEPRGAAFAERG
jgi:hypothetical protein